MPESRAYLVCNDQKINLKDETTIGRLTSNHIPINDPTISKNHSSIIYMPNENKYYLCDLNTINGTYLNGSKLEGNKKYPLKHKDAIQFGKSSLGFMQMFIFTTFISTSPKPRGRARLISRIIVLSSKVMISSKRSLNSNLRLRSADPKT